MLLMPPVPAVSLSKSARAWRFVSLNLGGCGLAGGVGAALAASVAFADAGGASAAADFAAGAVGSSTGAAPVVAAAGADAVLGGVAVGLDAGAFPGDAGDDEERPA